MVNTEVWRDKVEETIQKNSNGTIRVFQTVFASPEEALKEDFGINVPKEDEMRSMHPDMMDKVAVLNANEVLYVFVCNNGVSPGVPMVVAKILSTSSAIDD